MAINESSSSATPAISGDNKATSGGPIGSRPKHETAGVFGHSKRGHGVVGTTDDLSVHTGVYGEGPIGVRGVTKNGTGVEGFGNGPNGVGIFGQGGEKAPAIVGNTISSSQPGVLGQNNRGGPGILAKSAQGTGLVATGPAFAAEFVGKVRVQGDMAISGDIKLATSAFATADDLAKEEQTVDDSALAEISLAQKLAEIDARTQRIESLLNSLFRMTARMPDGRTLINVVGTIETKVNNL